MGQDKSILLNTLILILVDPQSLPLEMLEQYRGFLVYFSRTYICMAHYLKRMYQILSWRVWMRDDDQKMDLCSVSLTKDNEYTDSDVYQGLEEAPPCSAVVTG